MTAAPSERKRSIRPHRKSRNGCGMCKRRKVKCDEEKPCGNCVSFGLPCDLAPAPGSVAPESPRRQLSTATTARRGRGRPRKDWTGGRVRGDKQKDPATVPPADSPDTPSPAPTADVDLAPVHLDTAELLLHFTAATAVTFAGPNPDMLELWARNAPHMGLSHPFVLHLIYAPAAYHLAYLARRQSGRNQIANDGWRPHPRRSPGHYLALAQQHLTAGLSGFTAQLSRPGPENCGALYLGAVLTSYCTFAAGPTSRDDLLVCTADRTDPRAAAAVSPSSSPPSSPPSPWMPFVYGVRLLHQSFSPDVLFAGPMGPYNKGPSPPPLLDQPMCARDRFPRLDWEAALDGLRAFVARAVTRPVPSEEAGGAVPSAGSPRAKTAAAVCLQMLDGLIGIYEATYGRRGPEGEVTHSGPWADQFVFGWLYRVEAEFVARVRRREPHALLVLAHYAVLLNEHAVRDSWYAEGWREHIVARVAEFVAGDDMCEPWLRWPMEQVSSR